MSRLLPVYRTRSSLGSLGSRLSAADRRHLGEGEKSASGQGASVEPRAQTPLGKGNPVGARVPSASNETLSLLSSGAVLWSSFEKINKMDKSLAGLIREEKEEKASETKLQNAQTQNFVFAVHLC